MSGQAQSPVPANHPLMVAWNAYQATDEGDRFHLHRESGVCLSAGCQPATPDEARKLGLHNATSHLTP